MQFQTPQFIDVEDKIFGPLTFKQFVYLAGGAGLVVVLWTLLPPFFAVLLGLPVIALSLALAFYTVNNKPFVNIMESFFSYVSGSKLYVWKKEAKKAMPSEPKEGGTDLGLYVPRLSDSKLKDLTWSLGVKDQTQPKEKSSVIGQ
ncbi:MAG: PrgI family protein [Patescibacteria group bacterium]|nr:PrgI family protein [bacterium]MDZ4241059.1 PrgI family protein [Patescibacteria group bacterium]